MKTKTQIVLVPALIGLLGWNVWEANSRRNVEQSLGAHVAELEAEIGSLSERVDRAERSADDIRQRAASLEQALARMRRQAAGVSDPPAGSGPIRITGAPLTLRTPQAPKSELETFIEGLDPQTVRTLITLLAAL